MVLFDNHNRMLLGLRSVRKNGTTVIIDNISFAWGMHVILSGITSTEPQQSLPPPSSLPPPPPSALNSKIRWVVLTGAVYIIKQRTEINKKTKQLISVWGHCCHAHVLCDHADPLPPLISPLPCYWRSRSHHDTRLRGRPLWLVR